VSWHEIPRNLQIKYLHAAALTAAQLSRLAAQLDQDRGDRIALKLLLRRFHGLAAWAGLHGLSAIAVAAQLGEHDCATLAGANVVPELAHVEQIRALAQLLRQEVYRQRSTGGISEEILWARLAPAELGAAAGQRLPAPAPLPARRALAVGLLDVEWQRLEGLLSHRGFTLQAVETCREAGRVFADGLPEAVIAAEEQADGSGALLTHYLRSLDRGDEPVMVLIGGPAGGDAGAGSGSGAAEPRASCDADAQWRGPVDWVALTESLPGLIEQRQAAPRILYLGNEDEEAAALRALLGGAGYRVRGCRDPRRFPREVLASEPELVLMNLAPSAVAAGAAGDLVRWLRSDKRCAAVSVVVLEGDDGTPAPPGAGAAGTSRLARTAAPAVLLAAVAERVEHCRALKRLFADSPVTAAPARRAQAAPAASAASA